jgi:hypothetical protein
VQAAEDDDVGGLGGGDAGIQGVNDGDGQSAPDDLGGQEGRLFAATSLIALPVRG